MKVKLHHKNAIAPERQSVGSAGYDLYACKDTRVHMDHCTEVEIGISIQIPRGWVGFIKPRSGLAFKHGVDTMAGVIDSDYRGEIKCLLTSHEYEAYPVYIKAGERVAQLIVVPCYMQEIEVVDELPYSRRGTDGFGSTGK